MNIVNELPPNYDEVAKAFDIRGRKGIVFTYGDTVYVPFKKGSIPDHLKVHERTHSKQQGGDPAGWWNKYIRFPAFRLEQEIEAYRNQYLFFKSRNHSIKDQKLFLDSIASDLSSGMYGGIINRDEARKAISL